LRALDDGVILEFASTSTMSFPIEKSYRIAVSALLSLVLVYALAAGLQTVSDPDMGWHLATGRYVVQHHTVPSTDVLSYTAAGTKWIYPPFAGVMMYLIYGAAGYAGLSWFCALACLATIAYLVRRRDLASIVLAMCAVQQVAFRTAARADLFSTVFFAIFLGILVAYHHGSGKQLWVLPLIMSVWVNVHPGFVLGLAVIGAYLLLEVSDMLLSVHRAEALGRLKNGWPWLVGTAVITLLNPWGPKLYFASLSLLGIGEQQTGSLSGSSVINEFLAVPLSSQLFQHLIDFRHPDSGFAWMMMFAVLIVLLGLWQKQFGAVIIQIVALCIALQRERFIGFFCITTVILGGTLLGRAFGTKPTPASASPQESPARRRPLILVPIALALVFVCAAGAITSLRIADFVSNRTHVVFHSEASFGPGESSWFPERAASFIRRERLPGNIFQEYAVGGFAAWRLGPEYPDFIDGRGNSPAVLIQEQELMLQPPDSPKWQAAANEWGINVLLLQESGFRAFDVHNAAAFCQSSEWHPVYMDEVSLVLLRNTPANQPWLDRLQIDCRSQELVPPAAASRKNLYDFLINEGGLLYSLQRDQESEAALLRAAAMFPEDPNSRLMLAQLYHRRQMFNSAEVQYRASLARNETDKAWFELGKLYVQEKRLPQAEQAYSRAAEISLTPCAPYLSLAEVELRMERPDPALQAISKAVASSPYRNGGETLAPQLYAEFADDRADASRMLSRLPAAIEFEQEALRLDPSVANRWEKLAGLYDLTGQVELSSQAKTRALVLRSQTSRY